MDTKLTDALLTAAQLICDEVSFEGGSDACLLLEDKMDDLENATAEVRAAAAPEIWKQAESLCVRHALGSPQRFLDEAKQMV